MRYNFILRNEDNYPVERMCKCMRVSKNAYYNCRADALKSHSQMLITMYISGNYILFR